MNEAYLALTFVFGLCHFFVNKRLSGASLLSIEDTEEAKFINDTLELQRDTYYAVWLGLYKNLKGNPSHRLLLRLACGSQIHAFLNNFIQCGPRSVALAG